MEKQTTQALVEAGVVPATDEAMVRRVRWLIVLRLFTILVGIGLLLIYDLGTSGFRPAYTVLLTVCLLDLGYWMILDRFRDRMRPFVAVQLAIDILVASIMVYVTGSYHNVFTYFYFFAVLAACWTLSGRIALLVASISTTLLTGVFILFYSAQVYDISLPYLDPETLLLARIRWNQIIAALIAHGLAFHFVALLGGRLTREIAGVRILYEEILNNLPIGLLVVDRDRIVVFINDEARRLFEYTSDQDLSGQRVASVFRRDSDQRILELMDTRDEVSCELAVPKRDGTEQPIEVETKFIRDPRTQEVRGIVGVMSDLTDRKRLEEAERRADRLERFEEIALGIAHEIRNPMASIRGGVQELGRLALEDEDDKRLTEIICRESDRLNGIIESFLQYAKSDPRVFHPVDLRPLLEETTILLRQRDDAGDAKLSLKGSEEAWVEGDENQLRQVFLNLGINALEAMDGSGHLAIEIERTRVSEPVEEKKSRVRSWLEQDGYTITFQDTGSGIPADELRRIFTPFYTSKEKGTGLGLAMVEKIVGAHGGRLEVQSREGEGSTFAVVLRAVDRDEKEAEGERKLEPSSSIAPTKSD